ncbi:hypothetical protein VC273_21780 [Xanthomonas nasturtii]|uniref:hypothetical protein n=1 Tax=Xanthomonas TaxID=338 RepID=UPI002B22BCEA|nr:hypothetical protein [Xanthomonas nasturtii]MEA9558422.1 hypothetical protein [Xanthomonas nasturtii]
MSTFLGAQFAYRLGQAKDEDAERSRKIASLNRALLVLLAQYNEIRTTMIEFEKYPNDLFCVFNMAAVLPIESFGLVQKIDDLDFILKTRQRNILLELHTEQLRFDQVLVTIRIRAEHAIRELHPEMSRLRLRDVYVNEAILRESLGEYMFETAVNLTSSMRRHAAASDKSLPEMMEKLKAFSEQLFPGEKFIGHALVNAPESNP